MPINHEPVLRKEVITGLNIKKGGVYVDGTFGRGGYTKAILEKPLTKVFGIDPEMMLIDRGGHNKDDVIWIVEECGAGVFSYIGSSKAKYYEDSIDDEDKERF